MEQSKEPKSGAAVLRGWARDLAFSMGIGGALLGLILIGSSFVGEGPTHYAVDFSWDLGGVEHVMPADDGALEAWVASLGGIEEARMRRHESEGNHWLEIKFDARWVGGEDPEATDIPSFEAFVELYEAQVIALGYGRPVASSKSSQSPASFNIGWFGRLFHCFLLASGGFLIFGRRSWARRNEETGGTLNPPASTIRCLTWGVSLGLAFFMLGYALFVITGSPVPQAGFWFWSLFLHPGVQVTVGILAVTVVPAAQELFLRHHLYARMCATGNGIRGAIISSCLPALFLALVPLSALLLLTQGLVSCWLYRRTGRLLAPILLSATTTAGFFALSWGLPGNLDSWLQDITPQLRG